MSSNNSNTNENKRMEEEPAITRHVEPKIIHVNVDESRSKKRNGGRGKGSKSKKSEGSGDSGSKGISKKPKSILVQNIANRLVLNDKIKESCVANIANQLSAFAKKKLIPEEKKELESIVRNFIDTEIIN